MLRNLFSLLIFICLNAQITAYTFHFDSVTTQFEKTFFNEVIKLYNKKYDDTLNVTYTRIENFRDLFANVTDEHKISISSITITEKRKEKYDFSYPYLPIRYAIFALKKSQIENWKTNTYTIGYIKGTTDESFAKQLIGESKLVGVSFDKHSEKIKALHDGKIDLIASEILTNFVDPKLEILSDFIREDISYGILFKKNSELRKRMDRIIQYYVRTPLYYKLLKQTFGPEVAKILHRQLDRN